MYKALQTFLLLLLFGKIFFSWNKKLEKRLWAISSLFPVIPLNAHDYKTVKLLETVQLSTSFWKERARKKFVILTSLFWRLSEFQVAAIKQENE